MATPSELEALSIEEAHRAAQARLGLAAAYLAKSQWAQTSATGAGQTGQAWVETSLRIISAVRRKSRELTIAYVQLQRALDIGRTLGDPISGHQGNLTMDDLRNQFTDVLKEISTIDTAPSHDPNPDVNWFETSLRSARIEQGTPKPDQVNLDHSDIDTYMRDMLDKAVDNGSERVTVDPFDWTAETTPQQIEDAFTLSLHEDVLKRQADAVKRIKQDQELKPEEVVTAIDKAHQTTGNVGAGRVDRYSISEGREVLEDVAQRDEYVQAWARGTRPNCCAFCAMLASRGFTYKSQFGSMFTKRTTSRKGNDVSPSMDGGFRLYHDNCKCFPILRWVKKPTLPPQSAFFQAQWAVVTEGYSSKDGSYDALNAWRRWLGQQRRAGTLHEVDLNPSKP